MANNKKYRQHYNYLQKSIVPTFIGYVLQVMLLLWRGEKMKTFKHNIKLFNEKLRTEQQCLMELNTKISQVEKSF